MKTVIFAKLEFMVCIFKWVFMTVCVICGSLKLDALPKNINTMLNITQEIYLEYN